MTDNQLLLSISADTSNFTAAVEKIKKQFKEVQSTFSKHNKISLFSNAASEFAKNMDVIEKKAAKTADKIKAEMKEATGLDDDAIDRYYREYLAMVNEITADKKHKEKEVDEYLDKIIDAQQRRQLANLKRKNRKEKERIDEIEAYEKRKADVLWKRRLSLIRREEKKRKELADNIEAYEKRKADVLWKRELANIRRRERKEKEAANRIAKQRKSHWDFTGHRGLIDSTVVVAKYGAISQALFGLQNAFKSTVEQMIKFDAMSYKITAILGQTGAENKQLVDTVKQLGVAYGGTFTEIEEGMIALGRAGVEQTAVLSSATKVLKEMAMITGDTMQEGSDAMSSFANVFNLKTSEAIQKIGDQMMYVANATRLGLKDFSTISNYALVAAHSLGIEQEAYLALNGAMSKVGLNASTIGTSIQRIQKLTQDSSKANVELFRMMGLRQEEFADALRGPDGGVSALKDFMDRLASMSDEQYTKAIKDLPVLVKKTVNAMRAAGENNYFGEFINKFNTDLESTSEQAKKMSVSIEVAVQRVKNSFLDFTSDVATDIFDSFFDRTNVDAFDDSIADLEETFSTLKNTVEILLGLAIGAFFGNLVKGAGLAVTELKTLNGVVVGLTGKLRTMITLMGGAAGVVGAGVAGAALVINEAVNGGQTSREAMGNLNAGRNTEDVKKLQENIDQLSEKIKEMKGNFLIGDEYIGRFENQLVTLKNKMSELKAESKETKVELSDFTGGVNVTGQKDLLNTITGVEETTRKIIPLKHEMTDLDKKRLALIKGYEQILSGNATSQQIADQQRIAAIKAQKELVESLAGDEGKVTEYLKEKAKLLQMQVSNRKALTKESEKGLKTAKSAAKLMDREAKNATKLAMLKAKIQIQEKKNAIWAKGGVLTAKQKYDQEVKILKIRKDQLWIAYQLAAANDKGPQSHKAALEALLEYKKAVGDLAKKINEPITEMSKSIADGLEKGFEAVLNGDIQGAFASMYKDLLSSGAKWAAEQIATSSTVGEVLAALGIATQAQGEPYTAWARMAAMAATMGALGLFSGSISGGASGISQQQMDFATGANTAKSDTVANSLEAIKQNGVQGLEYSRRMADSLDTLVSYSDRASASIGDTLSGRGYDASGKNSDTIWGGKTYELISQGITINPASIKDFENGVVKGDKYMAEKVTKSSWFGSVSKEKLYTSNLGPADTKFMEAYTEAFLSGVDALAEAAEVLGVTEEQFDAFTEGWEMALTNLNFEGLDAEERANLIMESLGAQLDSVASTLVTLNGYVEQYGTAAEKPAETIIRLANEYEVVNRSMENLNMTLPSVAQGGIVAAESLIDLAGGLDKFKASTTTLLNALYSDEEREAIITNRLEKAFKAVNLNIPLSKEAMKIMYEELTAKKLKLEHDASLLRENIKIAQAQIHLEVVKAHAYTESVKLQIASLRILQETLKQLEEDLKTVDAQLKVFYDNAGDIADYVGFMDEHAKEAADEAERIADEMERAAEEAAQLAENIMNLQAEWMTSLKGAQAKYNYIAGTTGITTSFETFLRDFTAASSNMTSEQYEAWSKVSAALKELQTAIEENTKVNEGGIRVAEMREAWGAPGQYAARKKAIEKETGLYGLTVENFLSEFNKAVAKGLTVEDFEKWQKMSDILSEARDKQLEAAKKQKDFYEDLIHKIENAYLGSLSYLNSYEKAQYAARMAQIYMNQGDTQSYFDSLSKQLEYEKKMSITREDYIPLFESYIEELKNSKPEKTVDDAVEELEDLNDKIDDLIAATKEASYQGAFT